MVTLPAISVVVPSFNQAAFLPQALDSLLNQAYPNLEVIVVDGGSTDGSVVILEQYSDRLAYWVSEPDRGPAHAINKGFQRATGEILAWLNSDDLLAPDALWVIARAFADHPEVDMVYANAEYINEHNQPFFAHRRGYRTSHYYGEIRPYEQALYYWQYMYAVPQPTVYFRRQLLEYCGGLNETLHFVFDVDLFWRFSKLASVRKLERTQAFYRIHSMSKTSDWNQFRVELYQISRAQWPSPFSREFWSLARGYVNSYMRYWWKGHPRKARYWLTTLFIAVCVVLRFGNPEKWRGLAPRASLAEHQPLPSVKQPDGLGPTPAPVSYTVDRSRVRCDAIFCSFSWPRHPGRSGGEIRDFHFIRHLLSLCRVSFYSLNDLEQDEREDSLRPHLEALHLNPPEVFRPTARKQQFDYHAEAERWMPRAAAFAQTLQHALGAHPPDFLFVTPQLNPVMLFIDDTAPETRTILGTYDVEAVRVERLLSSAGVSQAAGAPEEIERAVRFETDYLHRFDGVIAVSELDKQIFIDRYAYPPERILVIENSVDPAYFAFEPRRLSDHPAVILVGTQSYPPNQAASLRLLDHIMPLVRKRQPRAEAWIVGQHPSEELLSYNQGDLNYVTGSVEDVRPYLAVASVACVPLTAGSGTKYKIIEAMSAGVPVVCTAVAAEGLLIEHERHALIAEDDETLADYILRLLGDAALVDSMVREARALVEEHYSWEANLKRLAPWLDEIATLPPYHVLGTI